MCVYVLEPYPSGAKPTEGGSISLAIYRHVQAKRGPELDRSSSDAKVALPSFIRANLLEVMVGIALLATGAAIYYKDELLIDSLRFEASGVDPAMSTYFSDEVSGGTSTVTPTPDEPLSWSCELTTVIEYPFCGFVLLVGHSPARGLDVSDFDSVTLQMAYDGPGRLMRVYLKNNNPAYSRPGKPERDKYNYVDVAALRGVATYDFPISRFAVADWWKAAEQIAPEHSSPEFTNVVGVEVQFGQDSRAGVYNVQIEEISFERRIISDEQFYGGLAGVWILLITGALRHKRREARLRAQEEAERLRWASDHDPLTNLPNRRAFQQRLQASILRAMEQGSSTALLLLDLDHFKHINDSFGHGVGDDILKCAAERLLNAIDRNSFVGRIGGDEFAIIIEDVKADTDVIAIGNRVLQKLKEPMQIADRHLATGGSIGAAIFPLHGGCASELVNSADSALYALKNSGRGGTKLLDEQVLESARRSASHLSMARSAAEERRIMPFYQPIVELSTGRIAGFEALLRCDHSEALHPASALEEAFADYEVATRLSELMHQQIAQDVAGWVRDGLEVGRVALNAAPAEFLRDDYAERLLSIFCANGVLPRNIAVEVTEHVFLGRSAEFVARAVELLRNAGVQIYLDDFGTGYSSLSHLLELKVDAVKMDKSFVDKLLDGGDAAAIVSSVVSLAKSLGISTVAEGVETEPQAVMLRHMGCDFGQGYQFGRPMNAQGLVEWISRKAAA